MYLKNDWWLKGLKSKKFKINYETGIIKLHYIIQTFYKNLDFKPKFRNNTQKY